MNRDLVTCAKQSSVAGRQRFRSNAHIEFAAAPCDKPVIGEPQLRAAERDFNSSSRFVIADEEICDSERVRVERAADGDAELPLAGAAKVLHARQETGAKNNRIHIVDLSNSSRVIARKRTRSPARKSAGGLFFGSNKRSGVRPIRFQPPGDFTG